MVKVSFKIKCPIGLHARVAGAIASSLESLEAETLLRVNDREARGNSVIGMILLHGRTGDTVIVESQGKDANKAVEVVSNILMKETA